MAQSFLTDGKNIETVNTISSTSSATDPYNIFALRLLKSTNNFPLCIATGTCSEIALPETPNVPQPPVDPNEGNGVDGFSLRQQLFKVNFNTIYSNTSNLPTHTDTSDKRYLIREVYLPDGKQIDITIDMKTKGLIVTTITGDTGFDRPLIKTTTYEKNKFIKTVYS